MIQLSLALRQVSAARDPRAIEKMAAAAERAAIGRAAARLPGYISSVVSKLYNWDTRERLAGDPGAVPGSERVQVKASMKPVQQRLPGMETATEFRITGRRRHLQVVGLPFRTASQSSWRGDDKAFRSWRRIAFGSGAATPYQVVQPRKGRGSFGSDKARLLIYPSKLQGIPLLFRRSPEFKLVKSPRTGRMVRHYPIDVLRQGAIPEKAVGAPAVAVWRPKLEALIQQRMEHETERQLKLFGAK